MVENTACMLTGSHRMLQISSHHMEIPHHTQSSLTRMACCDCQYVLQHILTGGDNTPCLHCIYLLHWIWLVVVAFV